jgi:hypothetical protein
MLKKHNKLYLTQLRKRYKKAGKAEKKSSLDEFTKTTVWSRLLRSADHCAPLQLPTRYPFRAQAIFATVPFRVIRQLLQGSLRVAPKPTLGQVPPPLPGTGPWPPAPAK